MTPSSLVVLARGDAREASSVDDSRRPCVDVHIACDSHERGDESSSDDESSTDDAWDVVVARATSNEEVTTERTSTSGRGRTSRRVCRAVVTMTEESRERRLLWTTTRDFDATTRTASARGCFGGISREFDEEDGVGETMVTWRTKSAIVGIAWTNAGDAVACATEDGSVVVARARDGVFAWTREGDEEGRGGGGSGGGEGCGAVVCAGDDERSDSVAVAYDGGDGDARAGAVRVVYADVSTPDDRLRHPARVLTMRRRGDALAALCADGAIRLWTRAHDRRRSTRLTRTIQTPSGGTTPIVAFDWLDASAARYDYPVSYTHLTLPTICSV